MVCEQFENVVQFLCTVILIIINHGLLILCNCINLCILQIKKLEGPFEIVSLVGTLSAGGHIHGSFSDASGNVIGGHVMGDAVVYTTAEIVIGNCTWANFTREHCDKSGYLELVVNDNDTRT